MYRIDDAAQALASTTRGDTLVVAPRAGSVACSVPRFKAEIKGVIAQLNEPAVRNLVLDLGGVYPGVRMLVAIDTLLRAARLRGGRVALAGVTNETAQVMRVLGLDAGCTLHLDRPAALAAVATEPLGQRAWRQRRLVAAAALLLFPLAAAIAGAMPYQQHQTADVRVATVGQPAGQTR